MLKRLGRFVREELAKTAQRPARLIRGPLLRGTSALLRHPRLVPIVLPALPERLIKKTGRESLYLIAAYKLLQSDWPSEAWLCIQRYLRIGRPSIEEYLLAANCLYQGLGRFHDAMAVLTQANEQSLRETVNLGLADVSLRVLDSVWAQHLGHLGILGYVLELGILEGRRRDETILYLPPGSPVANRFLVDQLARHLRLIENPNDLPFPASAVQALHYSLFSPRLPDGTTTFYWELADQTYRRWLEDRRPPLLALPPEIEARGRAVLEGLGMPQGAWFVALHVREREPDGTQSGINAIRNADISTYFPAIAEITRRGGWVIRIGDPSMAPLPSLPNVIDYCHSAVRSDWMDIFILARCRFLIGTNSGPAFVPVLYGSPAVLTNWWPAAERPWQSSDIFIPKMLRSASDGRYLTLSETLSEPLGWCYSRRHLLKCAGVYVEDNDPQIIRAAVEEMLARLDGRLEPSREMEDMRARADGIYKSRRVAGSAALAGEFLRRYCDLVA